MSKKKGEFAKKQRIRYIAKLVVIQLLIVLGFLIFWNAGRPMEERDIKQTEITVKDKFYSKFFSSISKT